MKFKKIMAGLTLCCCSLFALLGLGGCGGVTLSTIQENFDKLDATYKEYSSVFTQGVVDNMDTNYMIKYGTIVDGYVTEKREGYVELLDIYNSTLVISSDYIDNNKEYIKNLDEKNLSKESKTALKDLNESLVEYTDTISDFVRARKTFVDYFEEFNGQLSEESSSAYLRKFKKSYGELVSKNIELSMSLASAIETTEIFDLLKKTTPTENDTKIMKEYIRAKMLPIFSEFKITELENNLNWQGQAETETKDRIDNLLASLESKFATYKARFVGSNENVSTLTSEEMNQLFDYVENFLAETDAYIQALKGLNISVLAVDYDNNMEKYLEKNPLAETYLEKMEQFIGTTLTNFMDQVVNIIY